MRYWKTLKTMKILFKWRVLVYRVQQNSFTCFGKSIPLSKTVNTKNIYREVLIIKILKNNKNNNNNIKTI